MQIKIFFERKAAFINLALDLWASTVASHSCAT